ncbi:DUF4199 domain-containing protein [uncultured Microscilla sp.]|uniref:DUF4199 domain-containing protein n=1 Tax=uncultured Microscilla sp. TaxID=432653 RepID=UPI002601F590|nr:DUF4199 domain-containing protein [uncultured Microscilla sp.]
MLRKPAPTTSTARVALRFGVITGLLLNLYNTLLLFLWFNAPWDVKMMGYVILAGGIVYAMREFRAYNKKGMNLIQGLGLGTMLSAVASLVYGLVNMVIIALFAPASAQSGAVSILFINTIVVTVIIGVIISLVASLFYKTDNTVS